MRREPVLSPTSSRSPTRTSIRSRVGNKRDYGPSWRAPNVRIDSILLLSLCLSSTMGRGAKAVNIAKVVAHRGACKGEGGCSSSVTAGGHSWGHCKRWSDGAESRCGGWGWSEDYGSSPWWQWQAGGSHMYGARSTPVTVGAFPHRLILLLRPSLWVAPIARL